ncbi:hypothetical protein FOZG_00817 [Fusarium oxysporum Fo47]|uniref:Uncharacterized protein n=1 Tax=Fusarium oxysporum Fo47 TaxID=660027 RepID=W9L586_FUSOX|nr:hypothetical protein FOZG_00817 [Fusarium oxysporum Fo47]
MVLDQWNNVMAAQLGGNFSTCIGTLYGTFLHVLFCLLLSELTQSPTTQLPAAVRSLFGARNAGQTQKYQKAGVRCICQCHQPPICTGLSGFIPHARALRDKASDTIEIKLFRRTVWHQGYFHNNQYQR